MNIKRATHIARHNLCVEAGIAKVVPNRPTHKWLEFWKIIVVALEKQTAKKPFLVEDSGIRYTDTYRCPICEGSFTGTGIADYCYHCGQHIDWDRSEGEE